MKVFVAGGSGAMGMRLVPQLVHAGYEVVAMTRSQRKASTCGPLAEATLAGLNIDVVFVGVTAISVDAGCTTQHEVEAHTDRVLLSRARHVIVVADSSKVGEVAFAQICPLAQVDEFITDRQLGDAHVAELEAAGVRVTRV